VTLFDFGTGLSVTVTSSFPCGAVVAYFLNKVSTKIVLQYSPDAPARPSFCECHGVIFVKGVILNGDQFYLTRPVYRTGLVTPLGQLTFFFFLRIIATIF
jgi:hypothetical protein